jgi:hypothetical protein
MSPPVKSRTEVLFPEFPLVLPWDNDGNRPARFVPETPLPYTITSSGKGVTLFDALTGSTSLLYSLSGNINLKPRKKAHWFFLSPGTGQVRASAEPELSKWNRLALEEVVEVNLNKDIPLAEALGKTPKHQLVLLMASVTRYISPLHAPVPKLMAYSYHMLI